jgi:hypothetical protein
LDLGGPTWVHYGDNQIVDHLAKYLAKFDYKPNMKIKEFQGFFYIPSYMESTMEIWQFKKKFVKFQ